MTAVSVHPIMPKKAKGKLVFSYTSEFYLCKQCVGDFDDWMIEKYQDVAETVTVRNEFDEKL